jgi:dihydrofolate reductase
MRNLIFFMRTSLDGFVAGLNGEMDWIKLDDVMFDFVATMTDQPEPVGGLLPRDCQTYDEWVTGYSMPLVIENSHPDR